MYSVVLIWYLNSLKWFEIFYPSCCCFYAFLSDTFSASSSEVGEIASGQHLASWLEILWYWKPLLIVVSFQMQDSNRMLLWGEKTGTISSTIKCLRNKNMDSIVAMFMVFFQVPFGLLQKPTMEKWSLMTITVLLALTVRWTVSLGSYSGNTCSWSVKQPHEGELWSLW